MNTKKLSEYNLETKINYLSGIIRVYGNFEEKRLALETMGDIRLQEYLKTGDPKQRKLAANCYIAAKIIK